MRSKLIIAGGSGSLGQHLIEQLSGAYEEIIVLSRGQDAQKEDHRVLHWDAQTQGAWSQALEGAHAVINLTGKSIQCRFTEENKKILLDSRVDSTRAIGQAIAACQDPPEVWLNASGGSIYPQTYEQACTEAEQQHGEGFLAELSVAWEAAVHAVETPSTRKVIARITPVLDAGHGMLPPLLRISRLGLGGQAGNGRQMISWIHHEDLSAAIAFLLEGPRLEGVFNLTAPDARSNKEFMRTLRKALGAPIGLPAPAFAIRMSSLFMGVDPGLILDSNFVAPARLLEAGFTFSYPRLEAALSDLL